MGNVEKIIELLKRNKATRDAYFVNAEKNQTAEYDCLMKSLQALRDDTNKSKEEISKNLQCLTTHKHSIYKLIDDSENTSGLPVSHVYHRQTEAFLSEATDFINKSQNVYKSLNRDQDNINVENITHDITIATNFIANQLCKIKSLITEIQTLQNNVDVLSKVKEESTLNTSDEDIEI